MNFRRQRQNHAVDLFFTLSLFCVFTVCALLLIAIGIQAYRTAAASLENTYSARTALSYVAEKVRQHDEEGRIFLTQIDGENALLLTDQVEKTVYETYIYPKDGAVCELVVREGTEISPDMVQTVVQVGSFSISELGDGFLELAASDGQGQTDTFLLHVRNSGGYSRKE